MATQGTSGRTYTQDEVAVYDGFSQVFQQARPMKATVKPESKLMEHPLEDGTVITDHAVAQPITIEMDLLVMAENYRDVYAEIKRLYTERKLLKVQTKADTYEQQLIESMPHEEAPDTFDVILISLKTKEVRIVKAEVGTLPPKKVKKPAQASTQNTGEVQPKEEGSWLSGVLYGDKK